MPNAERTLAESHRKASYQDVLDAPDNMVAQIIHGVMYLHSRPADIHAWASGILYLKLMQRFGLDEFGDGLGDWVILIEPELHLGADVLVPDIAGWRAENYPRRRINPWFSVVPDCVCEVLSPTTRNVDLGKNTLAMAYLIYGPSTRWSERCWYPLSPMENGTMSRP